MPTKKEKLYFNFDGIDCRNFGLIHINTDSGLFEEQFVANRNMIETSIRGNEKPLFNRIEREPLEFEMSIAFENRFTEELVDEVILWLFQDGYKPLYFIGEENKMYNCIAVGDSRFIHNGLSEGYFTVTMRCDSPYIHSHHYTTFERDLNGSAPFDVRMDNIGHVIVYPEISIVKVGSGDIKITNYSDGATGFELINLLDKEEIYINNEREIIETSLLGEERYSSFYGDRLRLLRGANNIKIEGACKIKFRYKYKFKF